LGILLMLTIGGTLGYAVVEGMGFLDALYMTVITLSTVGYGEVTQLKSCGVHSSRHTPCKWTPVGTRHTRA
jgi:hypothetical protein